MKRGFKAYGLNEALAKYRLVSTSNTAKKYKAILDVWKVYRKIEKLSFLTSFWYFLNYILNAIKKDYSCEKLAKRHKELFKCI
jgi:teichuronic acid biosynthesis glycosyltransferase TuaG